MFIKQGFVVLLLCCFVMSALAHTPEEGKIYATLGPTLYSTQTPGTLLPDESHRIGLSLTVEGDVDKNGGVELTFGYENKLYFKESSGLYLAEEIKRMVIGAGYRHWFNPNISVATHFVSAYSMGNIDVVHTDFASNLEKKTSAHDITEYGFDFSLLYEFWRHENHHMTIDLRYFASTSRGGDESADVVSTVIGYKRLIQKK